MSAYKHALRIDGTSSSARIALARQVLAARQEVVLWNEYIAFRSMPDAIWVEIISPHPGAELSAHQCEQLCMAAEQELLASPLSELAARTNGARWCVVDDYGTGTKELWHAV